MTSKPFIILPKEKPEFDKYYYKINITYGFVVGFIIDNIIPCTLGLPMKLLKRYGSTIYQTSLKSKIIYRILSIRYLGSYLRGFLD